MRKRFKVMDAGWGIDFDDNRHPRIQIGRREWSAVLYNHPANGWEVVTLETGHRSKHVSRENHSDESAKSKLLELIGGEPVFDSLTKLEDDLYEIGRRGAMKRWIGKTITLIVKGTN